MKLRAPHPSYAFALTALLAMACGGDEGAPNNAGSTGNGGSRAGSGSTGQGGSGGSTSTTGSTTGGSTGTAGSGTAGSGTTTGSTTGQGGSGGATSGSGTGGSAAGNGGNGGAGARSRCERTRCATEGCRGRRRPGARAPTPERAKREAGAADEHLQVRQRAQCRVGELRERRPQPQPRNFQDDLQKHLRLGRAHRPLVVSHQRQRHAGLRQQRQSQRAPEVARRRGQSDPGRRKRCQGGSRH